MSESPFQKFIDLVSFDQNINALERDLAKINAQKEVAQKEISLLSQELDATKHNRDSQKKAVDLKELEMKSLQGQQSDLEKKLNTISHHKEYQSISSEIENLKKKQYAFEDGLLVAWNEYENAQRLYDAKKQDIELRVLALKNKVEEFQKQAGELSGKIEQRAHERESKTQYLPEEWLAKYALMRKAVTNPVVPVNNNSCSACFYPLIAQDLIGLQKRQLLQCKSCFRFLYLKEAHENA